jgi:hypothetical protein
MTGGTLSRAQISKHGRQSEAVVLMFKGRDHARGQAQ